MSFCIRETSTLQETLSPSLCCLHPYYREELWKVLQSFSNSIYFFWSNRVAAVNKSGWWPLFPPCASVEEETAPALTKPHRQSGTGGCLGYFGLLGLLQTLTTPSFLVSNTTWFHDATDEFMISKLKKQIKIFTLFSVSQAKLPINLLLPQL